MQALDHHNHGRPHEAEPLYRRAHELMPERVSVLVNLAAVLAQLRRLPEAREMCERALALEPGHPDALATRALCDRELAAPDDALRMLDATIDEHPGGAVAARHHKGVLLRDLGRASEALACLEDALAIEPLNAALLASRAALLADAGRVVEALHDYRRALRLDPDLGAAGQGFIHLVLDAGFRPAGSDAEFERLAIRAIEEPWAQPSAVAPVLLQAVRGDTAIAGAMQRAIAAWPERLAPHPACVEAMSRNRALLAVLEHAVVPDVELECLLANVRGWLLEEEIAPSGDSPGMPECLALRAALARQCFINDYLYTCTPTEAAAATVLQRRLGDALDAHAPIAATALLAAASVFPLHSLAAPERLLQRDWPAPVLDVLQRQVVAPLDEAERGGRLPRLRPVDNAVSQLVQQQYEQHPYPRWESLVRPATRVSLQQYVRNRVPGMSKRWNGPRPGQPVAVLNAGCGTGQQPIDTALRLDGARILAIDLSRASLAYAARMAARFGLDNIRFAHADLLELGTLGERFDLIESTGVLHHLEQPAAGLRVLASLLAPGGVMRLALYSEAARRSVVAARSLIASRGLAPTAEGIRACRSLLLALPPDAPARQVARFSDFYSISECRDLLFHACEHRYRLAGVRRLVEDAGLDLLGFELKPAQRAAFARQFADPAALADFAAWEAFEQQQPDAFAEMYTFWVRAAGPSG